MQLLTRLYVQKSENSFANRSIFSLFNYYDTIVYRMEIIKRSNLSNMYVQIRELNGDYLGVEPLLRRGRRVRSLVEYASNE